MGSRHLPWALGLLPPFSLYSFSFGEEKLRLRKGERNKSDSVARITDTKVGVGRTINGLKIYMRQNLPSSKFEE